jgi:DNA-binding NtrC family response regulator
MSSRGRTVLIADDDPEIRGMIGEYLQSNGYEVLEAENGLEALLHVKRARPHVVILDLMMPRLGGLDALWRIRTFDPEIAVVVVTGTSDPELKQQALALGAAAALTKPVELADLLKAVDHATRGGPAAEASETREGNARGGPASPDAASAGRVLIVDDDAEIRALLEELLDQHGYATRSAATAASAFWALLHEVPDVVLLDISMPGLSGVELIPAIRDVGRDARIIMVSGVSDVELAKRALTYGAFDYVTKPVDTEYLLRSLEAAMMTKQA